MTYPMSEGLGVTWGGGGLMERLRDSIRRAAEIQKRVPEGAPEPIPPPYIHPPAPGFPAPSVPTPVLKPKPVPANGVIAIDRMVTEMVPGEPVAPAPAVAGLPAIPWPILLGLGVAFLLMKRK